METLARSAAVAALLVGLSGAPALAQMPQNPHAAETAKHFIELFSGRNAKTYPKAEPFPTYAPSPMPAAVERAPGVERVPGAAAPASQFVLHGVVIAEAAEMAFLQEPGQPGPRFVRVGETIGGFRLVAVQPDRARLAGPGGDLVVRLGGGSTVAGLVPSAATAAVSASPGAEATRLEELIQRRQAERRARQEASEARRAERRGGKERERAGRARDAGAAESRTVEGPAPSQASQD